MKILKMILNIWILAPLLVIVLYVLAINIVEGCIEVKDKIEQTI